LAGFCHQKFEGNEFKTKECEWVLLLLLLLLLLQQHSNTKLYLFTGIMERERSQPHSVKPESK
jgi:hypothetical protein